MKKGLKIILSVLLFVIALLILLWSLTSNDNIIIWKTSRITLSETNFVGLIAVPLLVFFAIVILDDLISDSLYFIGVGVSLFLILLAAILPHALAFFQLLYLNYTGTLILLASLFFMGVLFLLLTIVSMRYTENYRFLAFGRIVSLSFLYLFFFLYMCLDFSFLFVLFANSFVRYTEGAYTFKLLFLSHIIEPVFLVVCVLRFFKILLEDLRFLVYDEQRFILYLRSFTFDEKEDLIADELNEMEAYMPIMKIGNPKSFFPKGIGHTFYLPKSNWKDQLDYYIQKAAYVFSVVDVSEGVMWELFEHEILSDKFIYHISDTDKIKSILNNPICEKYKYSKLMNCFKYIIDNNLISNKTTFVIKDDKCYYSDISTIFKLSIEEKQNTNIPCFKVESVPQVSKANECGTKQNNLFLDIMSVLISYIKSHSKLAVQIVNVVSIISLISLFVYYLIQRNWMYLFALIVFVIMSQWMYKKFTDS